MMWKLLSLVVFVGWASVAWAGVACREASTGKLLELQQPGAPGLCQQNWVVKNPQYGYQASDITEEVLDETTTQVVYQQEVRAPNQAITATEVAALNAKAAPLLPKLGLTQQEFDLLQDVLSP